MNTVCTVTLLDLVLQLFCIVLLYLCGDMTSFSMACDKCEVYLSVIGQDLYINFQIKTQMRALLEYRSLNHYIRGSIWRLLNLVLAVNKQLCCYCKIRSILDPWFIWFLHNHLSSLPIGFFFFFFSHWRENLWSKLTSVTVKAVGIFFVKDCCQKRSGLGPKLWGSPPPSGRGNKARQKEAGFGTALLVQLPRGPPKALPTFLQMLKITHHRVCNFTI